MNPHTRAARYNSNCIAGLLDLNKEISQWIIEGLNGQTRSFIAILNGWTRLAIQFCNGQMHPSVNL